MNQEKQGKNQGIVREKDFPTSAGTLFVVFVVICSFSLIFEEVKCLQRTISGHKI